MSDDLKLDPLEPLSIFDMHGKAYTAEPELTALEALKFIRGAGDRDSMVVMEEWAGTLARCLTAHHPEMTTEKVLSEFGLRHITIAMARFLALSGVMPIRSREVAALATPPTTTPTTAEPSA